MTRAEAHRELDRKLLRAALRKHRGKPVKCVAAEFGVNRTALYAIIKRLGVTLP